MASARIKKNDAVVVIAGAQKGRRGRVLQVDRPKERVLIEGVNIKKKAIRRSQAHPQGGIEEVERPIHISNVMREDLYDAKRPAKAEPADKAEKSEGQSES